MNQEESLRRTKQLYKDALMEYYKNGAEIGGIWDIKSDAYKTVLHHAFNIPTIELNSIAQDAAEMVRIEKLYA